MEPKHGTERGVPRVETITFGYVAYTNATTGAAVYSGPIASRTETVSERYCGYCHQWQQATGLIGAMLCVACGHEWDEVPA